MPELMKPLGKNDKGFEECLWLKDESVMIRIPAGEFLMGSPEGEGENDENPQYRVLLNDYLIDKFLETNRQFVLFAGKHMGPGLSI